jgi:hypothetical protein
MGNLFSSNSINTDTKNLTNYYTKTDIDNKLKNIQTGNYLTYSDSNKNSINLSSDYLTIKNKAGNPLLSLNNSGTVTLNSKNQLSTILKADGQTQTFGIQNGNDASGDFLRIGKVVLDNNGGYTQQPFIRMHMSPSDTDGSSRLTYMRTNTMFSGDVRFGADNNYYTVSRGDLVNDNCLYLKRTDQSNSDTSKNYTNKEVAKWCPSS